MKSASIEFDGLSERVLTLTTWAACDFCKDRWAGVAGEDDGVKTFPALCFSHILYWLMSELSSRGQIGLGMRNGVAKEYNCIRLLNCSRG